MKPHVRLLVAALVATLAAGCDQASKLGAVAHLTHALAERQGASALEIVSTLFDARHPDPRGPVVLVPDALELVYRENTGAAFSLLEGSPVAVPLFVIAGAIALIALASVARKTPTPLVLSGVALIAGGAIGNLLDRVRLRYVVDFVHMHAGSAFDWPVFNVADVLIAVGVALLVLGQRRDPPRPIAA